MEDLFEVFKTKIREENNEQTNRLSDSPSNSIVKSISAHYNKMLLEVLSQYHHDVILPMLQENHGQGTKSD